MAGSLREFVGEEVRRDRLLDGRGRDWNEHLKSLRAEHQGRPNQGLDLR
jgi:hypothetical protein